MLIPVEWLKDYISFKLPVEELAELFTMAGLEVEAVEESEKGTVLDIKVTPNRGDCLSIVGLAREIKASLGSKSEYTALWKEFETGFKEEMQHGQKLKEITIKVEAPALCPKYAARVIENINDSQSPKWVQDRLQLAGIRSINAVVDATNYVLIELGQPLHAFDLNKLQNQTIIIREAANDEKLVTLDGIERCVSPPMLMICDAKKPVAAAGIMGGAETEVTSTSKTLLLESAHFNPLSVRRTRKILGLSTEASYRFERFVDPELVEPAANRVCQLLEEWIGAVPIPGAVIVDNCKTQPLIISLRSSRASLLMGVDISDKQCEEYLQRLGFKVLSNIDGVLKIEVPTFRSDIKRETDLVEEVGRVHGYEKIPEMLPTGSTSLGKLDEQGAFLETLRKAFLASGLNEVINHSLGSSDCSLDSPNCEKIPLKNPMNPEFGELRSSLLPGLAGTAVRNNQRGIPDVCLFEIGHIFYHSSGVYKEAMSSAAFVMGKCSQQHWSDAGKQQFADFWDIKGITQTVLNSLGLNDLEWHAIASDKRLHPGRSAQIVAVDTVVGVIGELHPDRQKEYDLPNRAFVCELQVEELMKLSLHKAKFKSIPRYQSVQRDLAFVLDSSIPWTVVEAKLHQAGGMLMEQANLFDIYTGPPVPEGKHSLAVSITLRKPEGTLTEQEISMAIDSIQTRLQEELGAALR